MDVTYINETFITYNETFVNVTTPGSVNATNEAFTELTLAGKITVSLMVLSMVIIVSGNSLVLIAVCSFNALRDITGIFIANLAIADIITGLSLPLQIVFFFYPTLGQIKHVCILRFTVIAFVCNASIFSLACAVVDRFIAISYPLKYNQIMTEKRAYIMIAVIWIVDFIYCLLPTIALNRFEQAPFCSYALVISPEFKRCSAIIGVVFAIFMFLVYIRILMIAYGHFRKIQTQENQHGGQHGGQHPVTRNRSYVTTGIVILFFQIAWLPYFSISLSVYDESDVEFVKSMIANFSVFLGIANSMVNPFIYAWKNAPYRKAFVQILRLKINDGNGLTSNGSV